MLIITQNGKACSLDKRETYKAEYENVRRERSEKMLQIQEREKLLSELRNETKTLQETCKA